MELPPLVVRGDEGLRRDRQAGDVEGRPALDEGPVRSLDDDQDVEVAPRTPVALGVGAEVPDTAERRKPVGDVPGPRDQGLPDLGGVRPERTKSMIVRAWSSACSL